jgi:transposase
MDTERLEQLKWACARGEIATRDAAKELGVSLSTFRKRIVKDEACFAEFQQHKFKRAPAKTKRTFQDMMRDKDLWADKQIKAIMKKYQDKSKLASKAAIARSMGLSYGQYIAMCAGAGRL